jgi:PAS domain S-box-containing protein
MVPSTAARPEALPAARYEAVVRLAQALTVHRDPKELFRFLASELRLVVKFNWLGVGRYHEEKNTVRLDVLEVTGAPVQLPEFQKEEMMTWWVHQHQQPLVIPFVDTETRFPRVMEFLKSRGTHSICALPLTTSQHRLGALSLGSEEPNAYCEEEVRFLTLVADIVALAIDDALNFEASQRAQDRLKLLLDLTNRLVANLDLQDVLRAVTATVRQVMQCDGVGVLLPASDGKQLRVYALDFPEGLGFVKEGTLLPIEGSRLGRVFQTGKPVVASGPPDPAETDPELYRILAGEGWKSSCLLPLISRTGPLGVLALSNRQETSFTQAEVDFLTQVANQVAIAMENALNFEASQRAQGRLKLLLDVTNGLVSNLELRDLLRAISASVRRVMQCDAVTIRLPDSESKKLRVYALDFPESKGFLKEETFIPIEGSLSGNVFRTGQSFVSNDLATDAAASPGLAEGLKSGCFLPLIHRDRILGVMGFGRRADTFTAEDVGFLGQVASQVAIAVDNALATEDRKRADEALRHSEAYLAEAQRLSHTGSFGWSVSSGDIFWSDETYRIFEYDRTIKPSLELALQRVHPEDMTLVREMVDRASHEGKDWKVSHRLLMPDASVKHVEVVAHALKRGSDKLEFVGAVMDVTERKRAEEARLEVEQRYRTLVQHAPEAIVILDVETGCFVDVNDNAVKLFGLSREELLRVGPIEMSAPIQADGRPTRESVLERVQQAVQGGTPVFEWTHRNAAGRDIPCEVRLVRLPATDRVLIRGSVTDISERKRAEALRAEKARQAALRADISVAFGRDDRLSEILHTCVEAIVQHLNAAFARIWTTNKAGDMLELQASAGMYAHLNGPHSRVPMGKLKIGLIAQERSPHFTNDLLNDPRLGDRAWAEREQMVAFAGYPLVVSDRVVGVVALFARQAMTADTLDALASVADSITQGIERKRTEDALRRSESYLVEAQRLSQTGSFGWCVSSGEIFWSEETYRIFEYDRAIRPTLELILPRVHPEDIVLVRQAIDRASHDGKDFDLEHRLLMPDGSIKHVHVVVRAIGNEAGQLEYVGSVMDITGRKLTEAALKERERELRLLIDVAPQCLSVHGADGRRLYANDGMLEYLGITLEDFQAHDFGPKFVHPDDLDRVRSVRGDAMSRGVSWEVEARILRKDGQYRWFLNRGNPLRDEQGRIVRWYSSGTDIEGLKRAEEALQNTQTELAHVSRAIAMGELTASIAHEVNQPLAAVVTNANASLRWLAGRTPNLDEAREAVSRIIRDANRASEVIARIRALSRKTGTQKERLDVNESIHEVVTLIQGELRRNRVGLRTELADDLPPVLGDRVQLQQVMLNLIMNGIEAMAVVEDRLRELTIRTQRSEVDQVRVSVQDSGIGLDRQSLERIFQAFYTTKPGGMGIGLSISRSIVENHGGQLWAVPNDGPGTTFQFTLSKYH